MEVALVRIKLEPSLLLEAGECTRRRVVENWVARRVGVEENRRGLKGKAPITRKGNRQEPTTTRIKKKKTER